MDPAGVELPSGNPALAHQGRVGTSPKKSKRHDLPPAQEILEQLEKMIRDGECYDSQQKFKSFSRKYITDKRYFDATYMLYSGACLQLKNGEVICGSELAILLMELFMERKVPCTDDDFGHVTSIYKLFPHFSQSHHLADDDELQRISNALGAAKTAVECCTAFMKSAIKWSEKTESPGNPSSRLLNAMLAEYIYDESPELDMVLVSYYFARGDHPKKFASKLVNFMGKCYPGEDEIAVARGILMYLAAGNLTDANKLLEEVKSVAKIQNVEIMFSSSDLIQFVSHLLLTLQRDAMPLFNMLRKTYKSSIDREPTFNQLLDEIAEKFYGARRQNPFHNMFGDIFELDERAQQLFSKLLDAAKERLLRAYSKIITGVVSDDSKSQSDLQKTKKATTGTTARDLLRTSSASSSTKSQIKKVKRCRICNESCMTLRKLPPSASGRVVMEEGGDQVWKAREEKTLKQGIRTKKQEQKSDQKIGEEGDDLSEPLIQRQNLVKNMVQRIESRNQTQAQRHFPRQFTGRRREQEETTSSSRGSGASYGCTSDEQSEATGATSSNSHYSSYLSSSLSRRSEETEPEGSTEEASSQESSHRNSQPPARSGRHRARKSSRRKRRGRFRRLKNKLGLIFHHHHHHHHHHNFAGEQKQIQTNSKWKSVSDMIHHQNNNGGHQRDMNKSVASKKQGSHFHALVQGLMNHVRHSNKSKKSKHRAGPPAWNTHWWQMRKRKHVLLKFKGKKPQLKDGRR